MIVRTVRGPPRSATHSSILRREKTDRTRRTPGSLGRDVSTRCKLAPTIRAKRSAGSRVLIDGLRWRRAFARRGDGRALESGAYGSRGWKGATGRGGRGDIQEWIPGMADHRGGGRAGGGRRGRCLGNGGCLAGLADALRECAALRRARRGDALADHAAHAGSRRLAGARAVDG